MNRRFPLTEGRKRPGVTVVQPLSHLNGTANGKIRTFGLDFVSEHAKILARPIRRVTCIDCASGDGSAGEVLATPTASTGC